MADSFDRNPPAHPDSDTVLFAILGMIVCAGLAAISDRLSSAPLLPWAASLMGATLAVGAGLTMLKRRRTGRAVVAAALTVLSPGLGQMSLGRMLRGSGLVMLVAVAYLSGWWWTAYVTGVLVALLEFAEQRRADDVPPRAVRVRIVQVAILAAAVLGAMAAFSISGGRARNGPGGGRGGGGAIIVLGGGRVEIGYGKADRLDSASAVRAGAAAGLWSTGRYEAVYAVGTPGEARDMSRILAGLGVGWERIFPIDAASTITSVPVMPAGAGGGGGGVRPVIVTHRYHIARTDLFIRALGGCGGGGGAEFHPVESSSWSGWAWMTGREALSLAAHLAALPWIAM